MDCREMLESGRETDKNSHVELVNTKKQDIFFQTLPEQVETTKGKQNCNK